jgi:error-prone DNA polymerase
MKCHFPAAFCAALLNGQPMGFWSPQTIVADARRHGVEIRGVDLNASAAAATLEPCASSAGGFAVRLGLREVRALGDDLAERIAAARPFSSMEDVVRRVWRAPAPPGHATRSSPATVARGRRFRGPPAGPGAISSAALEALATSGAFACFGLDRRAALWAAGAVAQAHPDRLEGVVLGASAPPGLPAMSEVEEAAADLWATGISPVASAVEFVRDRLDAQGVVTAARLAGPDLAHGQRVSVAGVVTHRQRPATAQGITFLNLEDETGLVNIVVSRGCWAAHRRVARGAPAMVVRGRLERVEGVVNVVAERLESLDLRTLPGTKSRDFR